VSSVVRSTDPDGVLEIDAPSHEAAEALASRLERCHCLVVQRATDEWCVRAQPWGRDRRSLQETLSAVEAWIVELGARRTRVALGERTFTLAADGAP
jgi:hypothetical protein